MSEQYPYPYQQFPSQFAPPQPPATAPGRGLAITSLVLGIVGAAMGIVPLLFWMALVVGLLGLIFGCVGRRHGMGKAGIVLSLVSLTLGVVGAVILANAVHDVTKDLNSLGDTPTYSAPAADSGLSTADVAFLSTVHDGAPSFIGTDAQLVSVGHSVCDALDAGNDFGTVTTVTEDSAGIGPSEAGYFVGAAIGAYCPADAYLIPGN